MYNSRGERIHIMFDTMKVAKRIRDARIAKNLTQMNLADAMSVSYQAVSNWERGNSMPDISKLEELCKTLDISVTDLLGMESPETATVTKILEEEEPALTVKELTEVAPVLPPEEVKKQARKQKMNLAALEEIAPYLDDDFLEELLEDVEVESLKDVVGLAPYLDEELLDELVRKAPREDTEGLLALAPFLDDETLDWVVRQYDLTLDKKFMESLAPFLEDETIDALVETQIAKGNAKSLTGLYPFMEDDTLRKVVKALMAEGDLDAVKEAAPFL